MAITAYTGLPGSGKSYSAVTFGIMPAIKAGRAIVTNLPLNVDVILSEYPEAEIKLIDLDDFKGTDPKLLEKEMTPGALVVLDELWRLWPSGTKTAAVPEDHKTFLAEHRHRVGSDGRATDILFVTQDLSQIASFARALVDKTYITQKLDALGSTKRAKINMYQGAVTGQRGPQAAHIRTSSVKYHPENFRYYRSHTKSETGEAGTEEGVDKRATIWRSPFWIVTGLMVFVVLPWAVGKAAAILKSGTATEETVNAVTPSPTPVLIQMQAAPPVPTPMPKRQSLAERLSGGGYRLVGYATRQDGSGLALLRNSVGYQTVYVEGCEKIENSPDLACIWGDQVATFTTGARFGQARTYTVR